MRTLPPRLRAFLRELQNRHVYRTGALYVAGAFVALQGAQLLVEGLGLPPWVLTFLIVLGLLGLPVALVLAWVYDLTPSGIRRADGETSAEPLAGTRVRIAASSLVLLLVGAAAFAAYVRFAAARRDSSPSIAVLPFAGLGTDPGDEYLRDGLTEDVLTQLAKVAGIRVISRTSIMQYKGSTKGTRDIAAELGVTHVLEGSVQRTGDRLRISAQLIDARTDAHVWAESYDRTLSDVFEVQSDIARRIAHALQVRMSADEKARLDVMRTSDPAAYDLYLRARAYLYRYEREANEVAIGLARKALDIDPELAPAHALLGTAFAFKVRLGEGPEWADSAMVAAQRAVTLDPELSEGHLALGNAYLRLGRYPEALRSYQRAAELNPSDWRAAANSAVVYSYEGKPVEALRWTHRAMASDPRSPLIGVEFRNLAGYYIDLTMPDKAAGALGKALETESPRHPQILTIEIEIALQRQDFARARTLADSLATEAPTDPSAHLVTGDAYLFSGQMERALLHYERAYALSPQAEGVRHFAPVLVGCVLWRQGQHERAERLFAEFEELAAEEIATGHDNYTLFTSLAAVSAARGDVDTALIQVRRAVESGGVAVEWTLGHDPLMEGIRGDQRYRALLEELHARGDALRRQVQVEGL